ncbi:hypothetical protein [Nonomuraea dietziae]
MTHVLAIGAHAGDMDLMAGAVLAQHVLEGQRATEPGTASRPA